MRGLPIYGYLTVSPDIPGRLVGTFDRPNTLGAWAVLACTFYVSSGLGRRWLPILLTFVLVFASSSATGLLVLATLGAGAILRRVGRRLLVPIAVILVASIPLLPVVTGRPDLFDSSSGRLTEMQRVYEQLEGAELATGKAFGAGTSAAFHVLRAGGPWAKVDRERAADSLPAMLLMGNGIAGLLAFYGLILWAAVKDPSFRSFWVAVFLTSLTIKVVEIFPVSLFLASALARVFTDDEREGRPT